MDSWDWRMIVVLGEEKSLTKAARRLYISQPSLSYRLRKLEREFDTVLVRRNPNGVVLTPEGEIMLEYAEEMIDRTEAVMRRLRASAPLVAGTVRLGVSTVVAKHWLAPILKAFDIAYPAVDVELTTGSSTLELPEMLSSGRADVIIKRGDMHWDGAKHVLAEEPQGIISSGEIRLERLLSETLIQDGSSVITGSDRLFAEWWRERFAEYPSPKILAVNSIEACLEMVSQGLGWTFLPKIHVKGDRRLRFYPLIWADDRPMLTRTVMLYDAESARDPAIGKFVEYVLAHRPGSKSDQG